MPWFPVGYVLVLPAVNVNIEDARKELGRSRRSLVDAVHVFAYGGQRLLDSRASIPWRLGLFVLTRPPS